MRERIAGLLMVMCLVAVSAQAQQRPADWSTGHKWGAAAAVSSILLDCGSTLVLLNDPNMVERNPLLGRRPSDVRVVATCAVGTAVTLGLAHIIGPKRRGWVLGAVTIIELTMFVLNVTE